MVRKGGGWEGEVGGGWLVPPREELGNPCDSAVDRSEKKSVMSGHLITVAVLCLLAAFLFSTLR